MIDLNTNNSCVINIIEENHDSSFSAIMLDKMLQKELNTLDKDPNAVIHLVLENNINEIGEDVTLKDIFLSGCIVDTSTNQVIKVLHKYEDRINQALKEKRMRIFLPEQKFNVINNGIFVVNKSIDFLYKIRLLLNKEVNNVILLGQSEIFNSNGVNAILLVKNIQDRISYLKNDPNINKKNKISIEQSEIELERIKRQFFLSHPLFFDKKFGDDILNHIFAEGSFLDKASVELWCQVREGVHADSIIKKINEEKNKNITVIQLIGSAHASKLEAFFKEKNINTIRYDGYPSSQKSEEIMHNVEHFGYGCLYEDCNKQLSEDDTRFSIKGIAFSPIDNRLLNGGNFIKKLSEYPETKDFLADNDQRQIFKNAAEIRDITLQDNYIEKYSARCGSPRHSEEEIFNFKIKCKEKSDFISTTNKNYKVETVTGILDAEYLVKNLNNLLRKVSLLNIQQKDKLR